MGAISKLWETFEMVSGTKGRGFESRIARFKTPINKALGRTLGAFFMSDDPWLRIGCAWLRVIQLIRQPFCLIGYSAMGYEVTT